MLNFLSLFSSNFLTKPAFFIGLIVFIGLLVIGKKWYEAFAGFVKTAVGFFVLTVGSNGLSSTFRPIVNAIGAKFGLQAAVVDTYFLMGQIYGEGGLYSIPGAVVWTMLSFIVSFVWNFILVIFNKYTKCRTLYVTGHTLSAYTSMILWFIYLVCPETQTLGFSILFGILAGTWAAVGSNITFEATQSLTNNSGMAIGHQEILGIWFTDKFAHFFAGKNSKKVEDVKLPGFLSIFNDNVVSTAVIMTVFLGTVILIVGRDTVSMYDTTLTASTFMITYILTTCFHFSVYMYILLAGVRMFVSELMKAFDGISKKVVKGAVPAVDCAISFNFSHPNVPLFGFIFGFFGQLVAIIGLLVFKSPLFLVPGFVPLFFDNATIAVYANNKGGKNAAVIMPFLNGIFQVLVSLVMILFIQSVCGVSLTAWPAFFDNNTFFALLTVLCAKINPWIAVILVIVALLGLNQVYYAKNKEHYYDHVK